MTASLALVASSETGAPSGALERMLVSQCRPNNVRAVARVAGWAVPAAAAAAAAWILLSPAPRRAVKLAPAAEAKTITVAQVEAASAPAPVNRHRIAQARKPLPEPAPTNPFLMIPYQEPPGPTEFAEIVRVNMPVTAAAEIGLPVLEADPSVRLEADLLLGENGVPRAWRPVRVVPR